MYVFLYVFGVNDIIAFGRTLAWSYNVQTCMELLALAIASPLPKMLV